MSRLFDRQVRLALGTRGDEGRAWSEPRIDFEVRHRLSKRGEATVTAFNLPANAASLAKRRDAIVRVFAGYGDEAPMIFQGTPVTGSVSQSMEGPDRVLEFDALDGGRALASTHLNLSVSSEQTVREVADRVIDQLGIPRGTVRVPEGLTFPQGIHTTGRADDVLRRLSAASEADWSIQDGAVQIVPNGEDTGRRGVVFSSAQGSLVGTPEQKDKGLEVTGLLRPGLRPGDVYRVESPDVEAFFKARDVKMHGSRFQSDFYTIAFGEEYPT